MLKFFLVLLLCTIQGALCLPRPAPEDLSANYCYGRIVFGKCHTFYNPPIRNAQTLNIRMNRNGTTTNAQDNVIQAETLLSTHNQHRIVVSTAQGYTLPVHADINVIITVGNHVYGRPTGQIIDASVPNVLYTFSNADIQGLFHNAGNNADHVTITVKYTIDQELKRKKAQAV
ncbi:uncharacterized protein RHO25_011156 [Cercospora beticola]|uniref:Uncharacterized protein n=1 Tax=Cercospora beticola TaxID=122368 RepID=A0ABZ0P4L5_CERBT|nr:hypothetical protein RHO25_011156 [Cercospora beticola]